MSSSGPLTQVPSGRARAAVPGTLTFEVVAQSWGLVYAEPDDVWSAPENGQELMFERDGSGRAARASTSSGVRLVR